MHFYAHNDFSQPEDDFRGHSARDNPGCSTINMMACQCLPLIPVEWESFYSLGAAARPEIPPRFPVCREFDWSTDSPACLTRGTGAAADGRSRHWPHLCNSAGGTYYYTAPGHLRRRSRLRRLAGTCSSATILSGQGAAWPCLEDGVARSAAPIDHWRHVCGSLGGPSRRRPCAGEAVGCGRSRRFMGKR